MERSVSLLIMTRLQIIPDGPEELVAVLQRRGEINHETMAAETWPGAYQLTFHGKVSWPDETEASALLREFQEESGLTPGMVAPKSIIGALREIPGAILIDRVENADKIIHHYALEINPLQLKLIRPNFSTGGFRWLRSNNVPGILDLRENFTKTEGVNSRQITAMFSDEIQVVKKAFTRFGKMP